MLFPIVLICLLGAPDDCTRQTALDVITNVEPSPLPFQCLSNGQFAAAGSPLSHKPGVYSKVICERR